MEKVKSIGKVSAFGKVVQFVRECKAELKKVVWPTRDDVVSSIKVVLISTIIIALILGALDLLFSKGFLAIMGIRS